jgi:hypothetical protein
MVFAPKPEFTVEDEYKGLFFNNGQHTSLQEQGKINMRKPRVTVTTTTTEVNLFLADIIAVGFGRNIDAAPWGIIFMPNYPQNQGLPVPGNFSWLQVDYSPVTAAIDCVGRPWAVVEDGAGPYLDNRRAGGEEYLAVDEDLSAHDSPCVGFPWNSGLVQFGSCDSFKMWLMYQSNGGMKVPLRKVDWEWHGVATYEPFGWLLTDASHSNNPPDDQTEDYPSWKNQLVIGQILQLQ